MRRLIAATALLAASAQAMAHDTERAHDEPPGWTLDPAITLPLLAALALHVVGRRRLAARSSVDRKRGAWLFGAGWLTLTVALVSPLHAAGERSFAAHMAEHELIMLVAAPLLVLAAPLPAMLWAFPGAARRRIGGFVAAAPVSATWRAASAPVAATLLQAAALWLWHAPVLFDRALASDGWHVAQHLSFLVTALLFWRAMLARSTPAMTAAVCLVATSIVSGALGALMAFATSPWYAGYARLGMAPFGLTPAEDQQLAGLLMWVPGGLVHAGAALVVMRRLLVTAHG